jgi:hypothetical protein
MPAVVDQSQKKKVSRQVKKQMKSRGLHPEIWAGGGLHPEINLGWGGPVYRRVVRHHTEITTNQSRYHFLLGHTKCYFAFPVHRSACPREK